VPVLLLPDSDPRAAALVVAIRAGDLEALRKQLREDPALARSQIRKRCGLLREEQRSLLHIATDWPGNFPSAAATIRELVQAGADVHARFVGRHRETPLHWAASSDDVEALDALLDLGADIEASGGVSGDGTALADAVAFGQWRAARRLVERGAQTNLWQAAGLGLLDRVQAHFGHAPAPSSDEITQAFWLACHGGQRATAEYLLDRGADLNWIGYDDLTALDAALRSGATELAEWLRSQGAESARD
jgi:ankyrin repeat protein